MGPGSPYNEYGTAQLPVTRDVSKGLRGDIVVCCCLWVQLTPREGQCKGRAGRDADLRGEASTELTLLHVGSLGALHAVDGLARQCF